MAQEDTRPNVIWIFGDQHRAQATGYMEDPNVHTPNIDRLAKGQFPARAGLRPRPPTPDLTVGLPN